MDLGSCTSAASVGDAASILALRKALDSQSQAVAQLLAPLAARTDSAQIGDEAMRMYEAALGAAGDPGGSAGG